MIPPQTSLRHCASAQSYMSLENAWPREQTNLNLLNTLPSITDSDAMNFKGPTGKTILRKQPDRGGRNPT